MSLCIPTKSPGGGESADDFALGLAEPNYFDGWTDAVKSRSSIALTQSIQRVRLEFQRSLIRAGQTRLSPVKVTQDGVIWDGQHAVRAAAGGGRNGRRLRNSADRATLGAFNLTVAGGVNNMKCPPDIADILVEILQTATLEIRQPAGRATHGAAHFWQTTFTTFPVC